MSQTKRAKWGRLLAAVAFCLGPAGPASAHAFGQRYDLPVPLGLYVAGAAAAVAVSFLIMGVFVRGTAGVRTYFRLNLLRSRAGLLLARPAVLDAFRGLSVALFLLLVVAGLWGNQYPTKNLDPTLVWVIWWVGLAYVSALGGNLWALINPWKAVFGWAERIYHRLRPGAELSRRLPYPAALGVWPGVGLFLAFAWVELVFDGRAVPRNIALMALGYSLVTWTGMFLFGRERWLRHGEAFSLAFGLLARFAPTEVRVVAPEACEACGLACRDRDGECIDCYECFGRADEGHREWNLRPPGAGLLRNEPVSPSMMVFVLLMLSTVTFDGFMGTPAWATLEGALAGRLRDLAGYRETAVQTLGLVTFPVLFLGVYLGVCGAMSAIAGERRPAAGLARAFVFTLVPITLAYHLAHYLTYLLIQGQLMIPLTSDPLGRGWDLLGTAGYRLNIAIVGARFVWYTAVIAIVAGHILAVYLGHTTAFRSMRGRASALRSQYPMSALMVGYTIVSLWILAQPIVESRARPPAAAEATPPGVVRVPRDAVIPEPGTGRLRTVGEGKTAKAMITYRVLSSSFHDGTRMTVADLLYPYIFAYRWGFGGPAGGTADGAYVERATALVRQALVGLRVLRVERTPFVIGDLKLAREVPVIEVYLNVTGGDPLQVASLAPPWSSLPWDLIVLMEEAVTRGWAAFSQEGARRRGVQWMDLVRGEALKARLSSLVETFESQGYIPPALEEFVSAAEARRRWAGLEAFYRAHGHFLVTNGPYVLQKWSEASVVLQVFRDASYPLGVGSFDRYAIPRRAYIAKIERRGARLRIAAEVEKVVRLQRSYQIVRRALRGAPAGGVGADTILCRYVVVNARGEVVRSGLAPLGDDGTFTVDLQGQLPAGLYTISTALFLNGNSMDPDIRAIPYRVERSR